MKASIIVTVIGATALFASCNKCTDCRCVGSNDFTFSEGMPESDQEFIREQYERNFTDKSEEVCARRGSEFESAVKTWEDQSQSFKEEETYKGNPWSLEANYTCTCD
ncbi:MAG: hypothetical protein Kow0075_09970 [Salibacteraceae bacterium]